MEHGIQRRVVTMLKDKEQLFKLLEHNPGLVIIKLGATWCRPCQKIKPVVDGFFASSPAERVLCCDIDVDDCPELYTFLKSKRMVNGIPVMLCYKKGNVHYIPDDSVIGGDPSSLDAFFRRCGQHLVEVGGSIAPLRPYALRMDD